MEQESKEFTVGDFKNLRRQVEILRDQIECLLLTPSVSIAEADVSDSEIDEEDFFPLKSVEDLSKFEKRLKKDVQFKKNLIKSLRQIGSNGDAPKQIGYYLLKHCFDPRLLQTFSFSGTSKNKNIPPKPGFNMFPLTIRLIFRVINHSDKTYSLLKNEKYLKNYFKHITGNLKRRRTADSEDEKEECETIRKIPKSN